MTQFHPTPIPSETVDAVLNKYSIKDVGYATIREIVSVVNDLEQITSQSFIRMEMGVPGLLASSIGVNAEIEALKIGVASKYPMLEGIQPLKNEASRFAKAFLNISIPADCCVPTVGSMQGSFASLLLAGQLDNAKNTILFIDPGFPVQKHQVRAMGYEIATFDVNDFRGDKLKNKLESILKTNKIAAIIYSNPNNPSWICLNELELETIGGLASEYDAIVVEDLAYFGMDFRSDISVPFEPPYQATVANYTDNYVLLISSSKVFSYAGQRVALLCLSPQLNKRYYNSLKKRYDVGEFGNALVSRLLYTLSSGTSHSAQFALAAMLKSASDGEFHFLNDVREYQKRASLMKDAFLKNGFLLTYDKDIDLPLADGFYFTISYPGFTGSQLLRVLLNYGISAIALYSTGSTREGFRACVSQTGGDKIDLLEKRLSQFKNDLKSR